jgi:hypothetical protein
MHDRRTGCHPTFIVLGMILVLIVGRLCKERVQKTDARKSHAAAEP